VIGHYNEITQFREWELDGYLIPDLFCDPACGRRDKSRLYDIPEIMFFVGGTYGNEIGCVGIVIPILQARFRDAVFIVKSFCH